MATAEERHIQLVRQTAVEVLECLGAPPGPDPPDARARGARPGGAAGLLPALAAGRPRDELLRQFSELSRLLKGRQGTSSHEEPETSLWMASAWSWPGTWRRKPVRMAVSVPRSTQQTSSRTRLSSASVTFGTATRRSIRVRWTSLICGSGRPAFG